MRRAARARSIVRAQRAILSRQRPLKLIVRCRLRSREVTVHRLATPLFLLLASACATTTNQVKPFEFPADAVPSAATESDAIPIANSPLRTKDQVRAGLGEPKHIIQLTTDHAPCTERWFYITKLTQKDAPASDVMTYLDFDGVGNVCTSSGGP